MAEWPLRPKPGRFSHRPAGGPSAVRRGYTAALLLILVAPGLSIFAIVRLRRSLESRERVVAGLVFILAVVWPPRLLSGGLCPTLKSGPRSVEELSHGTDPLGAS